MNRSKTTLRSLGLLVGLLTLVSTVQAGEGQPGTPAGGGGLFGLGSAEGQEAIKVDDTSSLTAVTSKQGLHAAITAEVRGLMKVKGRNRHQLGWRLQKKGPTAPGRTLVIAFEGTGAYDPYLPAFMQAAYGPLTSRSTAELGEGLYTTFKNVRQDLTGDTGKWSGLLAGPFSSLYADPSLFAGGFDWYSFASEEAEILAGPEGLSLGALGKITKDIRRSRRGTSRGIQAAKHRTLMYLRRASRSMGYSPKIVVLAHSSGCRSAVKFLQLLSEEWDYRTEKKGIAVDLVMTFDPVVEAHEVVMDRVSGGLGKLLRGIIVPGAALIDAVTDRSDPEPVRSEPQPRDLYNHSLAKRWVNVFQTEDTQGIQIDALPFGIHGSPVADVDYEKHIEGVGEHGHGRICYSKKALDIFAKEVRALDGAGPLPAPVAPKMN